ncbi:MAG TPA: hypothetical protein VIQ62_11235 [Burkholderiales bacterium]
MKSLSASSKSVIFAMLLIIAGCGDISSRTDFVALVKDKSTAEVEAKVGKPVAVDEGASGTVRWTYNMKTFSTESGSTQFDKKTVVVFRKADANTPATVVEVVYE